MGETDLTIQESVREHAEGPIHVLTIAGRLDMDTTTRLDDALGAVLVLKARPRAVLDLAGTDSATSAAWGMLIARLRHFRNREGDIRLVGLSAPLRAGMQMLELDRLVQSFASVDAAVEAPWN